MSTPSSTKKFSIRPSTPTSGSKRVEEQVEVRDGLLDASIPLLMTKKKNIVARDSESVTFLGQKLPTGSTTSAKPEEVFPELPRPVVDEPEPEATSDSDYDSSSSEEDEAPPPPKPAAKKPVAKEKHAAHKPEPAKKVPASVKHSGPVTESPFSDDEPTVPIVHLDLDEPKPKFRVAKHEPKVDPILGKEVSSNNLPPRPMFIRYNDQSLCVRVEKGEALGIYTKVPPNGYYINTEPTTNVVLSDHLGIVFKPKQGGVEFSEPSAKSFFIVEGVVAQEAAARDRRYDDGRQAPAKRPPHKVWPAQKRDLRK